MAKKFEKCMPVLVPIIEKIIPSHLHCLACDRDIEVNTYALAIEIAKEITKMGDT
jgi:hypothetical protein